MVFPFNFQVYLGALSIRSVADFKLFMCGIEPAVEIDGGFTNLLPGKAINFLTYFA